ncbi:MAG: hypothetical protein A3I29_02885 [Candidatus Magasanikbacteria bacterium RIFCSPLOWO2_02_FULL_44_11]|uniref:Phosphoribosyl-ATP pyrophosphohydrolase n=2 Tax=Candidatus Magasanikiibacteriota TaxID=1752731 RepID=A0A1F6NAN8_9BACT|nr:MAG: hypothetical protein A3D53_00705 [Candidatus Magasanikbacteria bacterium RIFCSPHIGHO2_02_FULL_45_10]OGH80921.1 MAG: hypothetical protein A3I29_02885 [Candidatus Magasanikbacteria bacterium RIFCSPLOWO2_02_FULL_44_11]
MTQYNKLVRDNIPEILTQKGVPHTFRIANEKEYWRKLKEKLREEVDEFIKAETIDEIADILEVLGAIYDHQHLSVEEITRVKNDKHQKRGGFTKRIILEQS